MPRKQGRSAVLEVVNDGNTVRIETIEGNGLRIAFDVHKTLAPNANRARVSVWNLSETTRDRVSAKVRYRQHLSEADKAVLASAGASLQPRETVYTNLGVAYVKISAGYGPLPLGLVFEGLSKTITHQRDSAVTWVTTLTSADGELGIREATLDKSYAAGVTVAEVAVDLFQSMGVHVSPGHRAILSGAVQRSGRVQMTFPFGFVASGSSFEMLRQIFEFTDIAWTIQDGDLVLLGPDQTIGGPPVDLRQQTGLVGSPRRRESGGWEVVSLLDHRIKPGARVSVTSRECTGTYRCTEVRHEGDTWGSGPHTSSATLEPIGLLGELEG